MLLFFDGLGEPIPQLPPSLGWKAFGLLEKIVNGPHGVDGSLDLDERPSRRRHMLRRGDENRANVLITIKKHVQTIENPREKVA